MFEEEVQEDETTNQEDSTPSTTPLADPVMKKRADIRDALKKLAQGNVQLGNFGQLSVDVDPFGKDKSASLELTVPFGKGRRR
ncbi:MAG: hypothetical protein GOVbin2277_26 [Prokaryotic dsDNA virus sp.]|jgi:hypothetical protein|nr:MAG: hypothetical protein GOVbin2277_26 [Prokaryotic dsDNA virus sp.]|tara:strand:+ start:47 stop:295 length:249 start_codon:yes stop_codon:yes gene_type:complete